MLHLTLRPVVITPSLKAILQVRAWITPYLHALQDSSAPGGGEPGGGGAGEGEPNGVYDYSSSSIFPTKTWHSANYWVDLVFVTEIGADTTPLMFHPVCQLITQPALPSPQRSQQPSMRRWMPRPLADSTFELRDPDSQLVPATVTYTRGFAQSDSHAERCAQYFDYVYRHRQRWNRWRVGCRLPCLTTWSSDYTWTFTTSAPASAAR